MNSFSSTLYVAFYWWHHEHVPDMGSSIIYARHTAIVAEGFFSIRTCFRIGFANKGITTSFSFKCFELIAVNAKIASCLETFV